MLCCSGHVGVNKINEVKWTEAEQRYRKFDRNLEKRHRDVLSTTEA